MQDYDTQEVEEEDSRSLELEERCNMLEEVEGSIRGAGDTLEEGRQVVGST